MLNKEQFNQQIISLIPMIFQRAEVQGKGYNNLIKFKSYKKKIVHDYLCILCSMVCM